jgi:hypothetical protein
MEDAKSAEAVAVEQASKAFETAENLREEIVADEALGGYQRARLDGGGSVCSCFITVWR